MGRVSRIERETKETSISLTLDIDGKGVRSVDTGIRFFDHMLDLFAFHSGFDLELKCAGDADVDSHHSIEDTGICLGQAFCKALGDKAGIARYSFMILPMDETLVTVAADISGRPYLVFEPVLSGIVGDMDSQAVKEFFQAFAVNANITLHMSLQHGDNTHHIVEALFKCFGRVLKEASRVNGQVNEVPSSKGLL